MSILSKHETQHLQKIADNLQQLSAGPLPKIVHNRMRSFIRFLDDVVCCESELQALTERLSECKAQLADYVIRSDNDVDMEISILCHEYTECYKTCKKYARLAKRIK